MSGSLLLALTCATGRRENLGKGLKYRKSSIKPSEGLFFSSTFEGWSGWGGGGLIEGGGLKERGAYLIWRNASTAARFLEDELVVTGHYTAFSNNKNMVIILLRELDGGSDVHVEYAEWRLRLQ